MPINIIGANTEDQRLTLTIRLWLSNRLEDHFFGHHPVFAKLRAMNRVVKGGFGTKITVPIKYPQAGGPQAEGVTDPYAAFSHSAMTGITSSLWDVAEYFMPISAPVRELKLQGSETKKLDYINSVMEIAMDRFMDRLRQDMWAAEGNPGSAGTDSQLASIRTLFNKGGSNTTGTIPPLPLPAQLSQSDPTWGNAAGTNPVFVVGGINRNAAGNAYFCIPLKNPNTAQTFNADAINEIITLATRGADRPDLLILERNHYNAAMNILQKQIQFGQSKLAEYGFDAFRWRNCDVIWDDDVPTAAPGINMFAINTKSLKLCVDSLEPDVQQSEDPERSLKVWKANWFGQLIMTKMGRGAGARHARLAAV